MKIMERKKRYLPKISVIWICLVIVIVGSVASVLSVGEGQAVLAAKSDEQKTGAGGGYAVSGQLQDVGYMAVLYDATNALPTSEANCVLGASDGYVWIGSYSGVICYDGSTFERQDASGGLTSARGLFEDSFGRIWVATNDNGVVVIDQGETVHFTKKDGLASSSVRTFAEDESGNVYIGTTAGMAYVDSKMELHRIDDERLNSERVLRLVEGAGGAIYGQTKRGAIFSVADGKVTAFYDSDDLGLEKITTILTDPDNGKKVYLGTESDGIYYGTFGNEKKDMKKISVTPAENIHWISYDCGRIWVASETVLGYLDETQQIHVLSDIPVDNAIEMMTSDYQGNLWVASSRQGVMKVVTNNFQNLTQAAGFSDEVVNVTCMHDQMLYIGTDHGIRIIDSKNQVIENELTSYIGDERIRHMMNDSHGNLWISTFGDDLGLVCYTANGSITNYTKEDKMPSDEIRCTTEMEDGSVAAGTNDGIAFIKGGQVKQTLGKDEGLLNTVILDICEGEGGVLYVGTDGDGIYVVDGQDIQRIGMEDGLGSDVVMKIRHDHTRELYWIVTSNSIAYMKNGKIKNVTTFPYNNNFDIYADSQDNLWILSSCGIYTVKVEDMLEDSITDYRIYTLENGLTSLPVANGTSYLDQDGNLYIAGLSGVSKVNIEHYFEGNVKVRTKVGSIYCNDKEILPNDKGVYTIPAGSGRVRIRPVVLDYTMSNPTVHVFLEGAEDDGITVEQSKLTNLEYTELKYGTYTLHIQIVTRGTGEILSDETFSITKKPTIFELWIVRILFVVLMAAITGVIVWRVLTGTVIRRQYRQIQEARDEAEKANSAKSRFLANMSHEIRTPINTILGMDEMILREDAEGVPKPYFMSIANYALDIRSATESLLGLVNDLLDISKIESGKMHLVEQEYDTAELLRSVISMIRVRSEAKKLYFDVDIDETLPCRLYGDGGKIKQIILNLLTNAVKYTDTGGFTFKVSVTEKTELGCALRISVKDTGIGVRKEDLEKLFTAYERLDEEKNSAIQGTGLGLDISRQFADLMNGRLWCESEYGEGSEFILTLSQKIVDGKEIGVFREEDDTMAKGPYVPQFVAPDADILVVDDNPMNLTVIKGLLKPTKVFVTTAASGEECLDKLRYGTFHVVLLDHMMPGMDGLETVAKIREQFPNLPVYALTANATAGGEEFYKSKGFDGYLTKPIDTVAVEHAIMRHLPDEIVMRPTQANSYAVLRRVVSQMEKVQKEG